MHNFVNYVETKNSFYQKQSMYFTLNTLIDKLPGTYMVRMFLCEKEFNHNLQFVKINFSKLILFKLYAKQFNK